MTRALQWPLTLVAALLTEKEKKNPQKNRNAGQHPKHHGYALAGHSRLMARDECHRIFRTLILDQGSKRFRHVKKY